MKSEEVRDYLEDITVALRAIIMADAKNIAFGGSRLPIILRNLREEVNITERLAKRLKEEEQRGEKSPSIIFISSSDD